MSTQGSTAIFHNYHELIEFFKEKEYQIIHVIGDGKQTSYIQFLNALHKNFNIEYKASTRFNHDLFIYLEKMNHEFMNSTSKQEATIFLMTLRNSQTFLTHLASKEIQELASHEKHRENLSQLLLREFHHTFFVLDAYHEASFMHYENKKTIHDLRILIISNQLVTIEELIQITFVLEFDPEYQKRIGWYTDIGLSIHGPQEIEMWRRKAYMLSLQVI